MSIPNVPQPAAAGGRERPWALITGASSGIGDVYARRLAERGYNLVLVARREDRLASLAAELRMKFGATVEVMAADLARREDLMRVIERIEQGPAIQFLINNAGFGTTGDFVEVDPQKLDDMVQLHVTASMRLTRAALPAMLKGRSGKIVNVASMSALMIYPGGSNYAATKAYLTSFSDSLQAELRGTGVRVQALCPGFTRTGFHDTEEYRGFDKSKFMPRMWMSAEEVVDESLRGLEGSGVLCIPGRKNKMLGRLFTFRPIRLVASRKVRKPINPDH